MVHDLCIFSEGRQAIMSTIDIFLGPILYPIAGPEKFEEDEVGKLPVEVQYLPETKTRIEDKKIRECILDILYSVIHFTFTINYARWSRFCVFILHVLRILNLLNYF